MTLPGKAPANRRASARYALDTLLRYHVVNANKKDVWKTGRVIDMSASGVRLRIPETVIAGTVLELEIDWTSLYHGHPVRLFVTGPVLRVDERGTVLRIVRHQFREPGRPVARPRRENRTLAVAS